MSFALVAAALAAGGCGGGSSDAASKGQSPSLSHAGTTGPPALSNSPFQSPFIARAEAICKRLNSELVAAKPRNLSAREIARFAPSHATLERTALTELSRLTPPASIARDWRQMLAYRRTLMEELVRLGRDAKVNDVRGIRALTVSKKRVHGKLLTTAKRDGFKSCSLVG